MSSDGKTLFGRKISLVIAPAGSPGTLGAMEASMGLDLSALRIVFKVKKTVRPEPNYTTVEVFNMADSSRRVLEDASKLVMRLEAGYVDTGTSQLYLGQVRSAWTTSDGNTSTTTIASGDSEKEIQEARIHVPIGPGVPVAHALKAIAKALKVGDGNLAQSLALLNTKGVAAMFGPGRMISGNAARELTDICRSSRLEWSVQDGQLQILDLNKPLADKAILLSANSGLEGSPTIDFNATSKTKKGGVYVKAKVRLIPELAPGRKVVFDSRFVKGGFRIEEIEYHGDTHGQEWGAALVCRSY